MKKLFCAVSAAALCAAMTTTAFAASPITAVNGTDAADVKGTYSAGESSATVYSVDVAWDSMEFTYTAGNAGEWDPTTHTYDVSGEGKWSDTNNTVTVTNHSNTAIDATLSYTAVTAYNAVAGAFTETSGTANDNKLELATAEGTTVANAPKATAALNLSGELDEGVTNTKIGAVTVTISDHAEIGGGGDGLGE